MTTVNNQKSIKTMLLPPLLAGGFAGLAADLTLYPLDTLKTRLQAAQGFQKAGGFRGLYKGVLTIASCSIPASAVLFVSYETTKGFCVPLAPPQLTPVVHMFAASVSVVLACLIRVPAEIAKQRKQTYVGTKKRSSIAIIVNAYKSEGLFRGVYRGFGSTALREIPFGFIELPVWELLKTLLRKYNEKEITSVQSAACGSIACGFAAAATTPLDLAKTRIMLAHKNAVPDKMRIRPILANIFLESGFKGLFAGVTPRMTGFMLGGFVFFGAYDDFKKYFEKYFAGS